MDNDSNNRDVYRDNGVEIIREGKNIFVKNTMTEEEHAAYIEQLKTNLPIALAEINDKVSEAAKIINSFDKIFVLGGIAGIVVDKLTQDTDKETIGEIVMEYCQSIAMATYNTESRRPKADDIKKLFDLLTEIRRYSFAYYSIEHLEGKNTEIEYQMRKAIIGERLFIRGDGYLKHIEELFREMFHPYEDFFLEHYHYRPSDIIDTFKQLESSFTLRVASPDGQPHPFLAMQLQQLLLGNGNKKDALESFAKNNPGLIVKDGNPFIIPMNWIPYHDILYRIRHHNDIQQKVVESLAMPFGGNEVFSKYNPYRITNGSDIYTKPIIRDTDGQCYLFNFNIGARNYFQIAQHLIKSASSDYYKEYFQGSKSFHSKDNYIERKVRSLFEMMLPGVDFYSNVDYTFRDHALDIKCIKADDGRYELDLLGISDQATYIIEIKAGLIDEESKRGAVKSLKTNLTKTLGEAICQSYRAYEFVTNTDGATFYDQKKHPVVPKNTERVFRITISFSYWGSLAASLLKLREFGVIEKKVAFAWTVNILDLMAFAKVIASEDEFIGYLSKRIPAYEDKRLENADEMDLLGLYYDNDFAVESKFDGYDHVTLNGYRDDFDLYFERNGKKPVKKNNAGNSN
jgi:hypothetical protein